LLIERESFIYFCVGSQSQITNNFLRKTSNILHQIFYGGFLVRGSEKTKMTRLRIIDSNNRVSFFYVAVGIAIKPQDLLLPRWLLWKTNFINTFVHAVS